MQAYDIVTHTYIRARDAKIRELYEKGCSDYDISVQLSIGYSTVRAWRRQRRLPVNKQPKPEKETKTTFPRQKTMIDKTIISDLYAQGYNDEAIAYLSYTTKGTIRKWRHENGLLPAHKITLKMIKLRMKCDRIAEEEAKDPSDDPESLFSSDTFLEELCGLRKQKQ